MIEKYGMYRLMTILRRWRLALGGALLLVAVGAGAQRMPGVRPSLPAAVPTTSGNPRVADRIDNPASRLRSTAEAHRTGTHRLADARAARLEELIRAYRNRLEMTDFGPAVRGEVIAVDPDPATLAAALAAGFTRRAEERIEGLDIRSVTLAVPRGWSVNRALSRLRRIAPGGRFAANNLHEQGGTAAATEDDALLVQGGSGTRAIGIIDGGVAAHPSLRGAVRQRGFVAGAPRPSGHGTAIASLIAGQGPVRGAAPGARLVVADIFGTDPAGGNALALARALGWMVEQRVPVVAVSLVGSANPLVQRAIQQARARGTWVVAAVGNDGSAAPPSFPASYPGVIAVTGVDGRGRVLIEAGRALHLDYAAPGADMGAAGSRGTVVPIRGTSFAVPLVASRLAHHLRAADVLASLDGEATQRGARGVGRGVICGSCRTPLARAARR